MTIRRPTLWPLAVTVLSEFASFLPTPPAEQGGPGVHSARVFVTAAATVVNPSVSPGGFLEASSPQPSHPNGSSSTLVPPGQAESDAATFTTAADPADRPDHLALRKGAHKFPSREPTSVGEPRQSTSNETRARMGALLASAGEPRPASDSLPTTFQSLLESNSSVSNLLELSDEMLENATKLIAAAAAVDALQGKQLFPNSSLSMDARSATNEPVQPELRRREEATIKELADHSGKLQQLFHQLEADLVSDQGEDALDAHGQPAAHKELAMAGIDDSEIPAALAEPSAPVNLRVGAPAASSEEADEENFRYLVTGLLLAVLLAVVGVGFCIYRYVLVSPRAVPVDETTGTTSDGSTSYVIRIVKARVRDLPSRTALAWQIHVGSENPRPSRFTKDALWDAPVDRLDVDVQDPREKISVAVLAASADGLEPPATLATVEVPAAVLLAEARGNKEKVANASGDSAYVHEKKLALYPRGELVLDYSLIAFFHWYVGGEKDAPRQ